jgi:hydroxymethylglutaryl-CoA synthase
LLAALRGSVPTLIAAADTRSGLPGSPDEAAGGDGAGAVLVGSGDDGPLIAEYLGSASATAEFLDRWRVPGESHSSVWEERYGEVRYTALADQAWGPALKDAGVTADEVTHLIVTGLHGRAVGAVAKRLAAAPATSAVDLLGASVGNTGAAHSMLVLSSVLDTAHPGEVVALVSLADGADVILLRTTAALASYGSARPVRTQIAAGGPLPYGKYLGWRGLLTVEPPRRPQPARVSATASGRSSEWKYGFVGSRNVDTGEIRLPPAVTGADPGATLEPAPMAEVAGTVVTFTIDRLAYSASPPVVFAVVDFDGGGRLPLELTDVDADAVAIGDRVEMTFRRLSSADGIHNYFWKARPVRA